MLSQVIFRYIIALSLIITSFNCAGQAVRKGNILFDISYGFLGQKNKDAMSDHDVPYDAESDSYEVTIQQPTAIVVRTEFAFREYGNFLVGLGLFYRRTSEQFSWKDEEFNFGTPISYDRSVRITSSAIGVSYIAHLYRFNERFDIAIASHMGVAFGTTNVRTSSSPSDPWIAQPISQYPNILSLFEYGAYVQAAYFPVRAVGIMARVGYSQRAGWINTGIQFVI